MPKRSRTFSGNPEETKVHKVRGIQVYGRRDTNGLYANLDAIDIDEEKIRQIADRLQSRGFGVMRQREARVGKTFQLMKATWASAGSPPDDPFSE